jgi:hypothetical protein
VHAPADVWGEPNPVRGGKGKKTFLDGTQTLLHQVVVLRVHLYVDAEISSLLLLHDEHKREK